MKCLVIDDHPLFRSGLREVVVRLDAAARVFEAGDLASALALLEHEADMDLVLLDMLMPGHAPPDAVRLLRERYPLLPVVIVSMIEDRRVDELLERGASGFVAKTTAGPVLEHALARILAGELVDTRSSAGEAPGAVSGPAAQNAADVLTGRQIEVLELLAAGRSNKQIARSLDISPTTVRTHVTAILRALDTANRTEAVRRALDLGLI